MKRHIISGRFGRGDRVAIPRATDESLARLPLLSPSSQLARWMGPPLRTLAKLGVFPTETGLDLLVLAAHVHCADTTLSRAESQNSWTREIRLVVPVHDPERWNQVSALLGRMLEFLTGDLWSVGFRPRPAKYSSLVPERPLDWEGASFDVVALFSGGLDSLIGAIEALEVGRKPLLVSHAGEGAVSNAQEACASALREHYGDESFERFRVWMAFPNAIERTTRARSFLFVALASFAGSGLGRAFTVAVPENGLIALNVPLNQLRVGAHSTRTTHPFYLARWKELLAALGIEGEVENPFWNKTKGEMVSGCANRRLLKDLIPKSMSCSSPTKGRWSGHGVQHCGYCLPCLIRRAALAKGLGAGQDPTTYGLPDLTARPLDTKKAEGQQVRAVQVALQRLEKRPELASVLVHSVASLADVPLEQQAEMADVYRRGMAQVGEILKGCRTAPLS